MSSQGGLILGGDGYLYGTTRDGGTNNGGTLFKVATNGTEYTVLHYFGTGNGDGGNPSGPLLEANDGALYGTTFAGGATNAFVSCGTVFKINKDGFGYAVLSDFSDATLGAGPSGGLIQASDGLLYGTASSGQLTGPTVNGTVFKLNKDTTNLSAIYTFAYPVFEPRDGVCEGSDGYLYGDTQGYPNGTVFKLKKDGSDFTILHTFANTAAFGLDIGNDGAIYGAMGGALYRMMTNGSAFTLVHSFTTNNSDGLYPGGQLCHGLDGTFYGTTGGGGQLGVGTLYRIWPFPTPDMLTLNVGLGSVKVVFAGAGGFQYKLFRSTNLADWTLLNTIQMPPNGIFTNLDGLSGQRAFYRAAWAP